MQSTRLTAALTVSPQLDGADFAALAADGVRLVINNRPDGEAPQQLAATEGAHLARAQGMKYRHIPVVFPAVTRADIAAFRQAVGTAGGAVHARCRSGTRSANLWLLGEILDGAMTRAEAEAFAAACGIVVRDALAWLDRHASVASTP